MSSSKELISMHDIIKLGAVGNGVNDNSSATQAVLD